MLRVVCWLLRGVVFGISCVLCGDWCLVICVYVVICGVLSDGCCVCVLRVVCCVCCLVFVVCCVCWGGGFAF